MVSVQVQMLAENINTDYSRYNTVCDLPCHFAKLKDKILVSLKFYYYLSSPQLVI
jgi:hypothetical protein